MAKMISAGISPRVVVDRIGGDISVVGWEGSEILIKADEEDVRVEQVGDEIRLSCENDISLRLPKASTLTFTLIEGDAAVRGVSGDVSIRTINGDLSMRDVGSVSIESINSDLSLRGVHGSLYVKNANGDVSIRDVDGEVNIESITDDLALRGPRGNVKVNVGADVVVYLDPRGDGDYLVTAGDDILLVLPSSANATVTMHGDDINVEWPGFDENTDEAERVVTLGNGAARIVLSAGGDVRLTNQVNAGDSADEFGNFAGLNFDWSGFGERISRHVEQTTARAARRAEEAARRAERHVERQARRWTGKVTFGQSWDFGPRGVPASPGAARSEPVSDAERLAILKMLQDKKITSEQAEQLLKALEGGS